MIEYREKLIKYKGKNTTLRGTIVYIDYKKKYKKRNDNRVFVTLRDVKEGDTIICNHLNILVKPKLLRYLKINQKVKITCKIFRYSTCKSQDNFEVRFFNYGVEKVYKIENYK